MGFFQRLEKALPDGSVPTLTEQYRMHPTVCKLVANLFYDGLLSTPRFIEDARTAIDPHGLWWLTYTDNDAESTPERSKSKQNIAEAVLVVKLLINGLRHGRSVMAITFYKAQENLIRRIFKDLEYTEDENCRILTVDQSQV
jgi:superfamily I DNA and/or RNA helicase